MNGSTITYTRVFLSKLVPAVHWSTGPCRASTSTSSSMYNSQCNFGSYTQVVAQHCREAAEGAAGNGSTSSVLALRTHGIVCYQLHRLSLWRCVAEYSNLTPSGIALLLMDEHGLCCCWPNTGPTHRHSQCHRHTHHQAACRALKFCYLYTGEQISSFRCVFVCRLTDVAESVQGVGATISAAGTTRLK